MFFQFVRPIVHIHFGSRPLHSPQVGLRVVFFTFHIGTQSCDYLKRISVTEIFENSPRPLHIWFENVPKSAVFRVPQPGHEPQRSPDTVPSVGMPRHVRFGAILGEVLTEIFEIKFFSRPRNFAIEIARDRAEISCLALAAAW